jgi:hypothetical protein
MGQTSSHKHFRSDFMKNSATGTNPPYMNAPGFTNQYPGSNHGHHNQPGGGGGGGMEYGVYNHDDLVEDEGISCPTLGSRGSYVLNIFLN